VVSVPHSGTRTLLEHTGLYPPAAKDRTLDGWTRRPRWLHFGVPHHAKMLHRFDPVAHIPVRHPKSVCASWRRRYDEGNPVAKLVKAYNAMFDYLETHDAEFYRVEDLPRLAGTDDHPEKRDTKHLDEFYAAITESVVEPHRAFFARFYEDLA